MPRTLCLFALLLAAGLTLPAMARAAPRQIITLELTADDGTRIPAVDVSDLSVGLSRTTATRKAPAEADPADKGGDETTDQASIMLDTSALSNPSLINWIGQGGTNSSVQLKVTSGGQATAYVLTGITTWSLSANHSTSGGDGSVSLSVAARHMTINGITVN